MTAPVATAPEITISKAVSAFQNSTRRYARDQAYYNGTYTPEKIGLATPPNMQALLSSVGWCRTYLDSIVERQVLEGFRLANAENTDEKLWSWWKANKLDELSPLAHLETLKHGCAYVVVASPDPQDPMADQDTPEIHTYSPWEMYADIDRRTDKVKWAVRVLGMSKEVNTTGDFEPDMVTIYLPNSTTVYQQGPLGWRVLSSVEHNLGVVPVVPIRNRTNLRDLHGHSEIFPELRQTSDQASRTMMNMASTMELMAIPQRVLFGVNLDEVIQQTGSKWEAYIARILAFGDAEGKATQFIAAEMRNFVDVMQELSKQAASDTGLPPQYLSFSSENPASAEAIKSSESRLVKKCELKNTIFGSAWEQVMRLALMIMSPDHKLPKDAVRLESVWRDPSTPTLASIADSVMKLATTPTSDGRTVVPVEFAREMLRFGEEDRRRMAQMDREAPRRQLDTLLGTDSEVRRENPQ